MTSRTSAVIASSLAVIAAATTATPSRARGSSVSTHVIIGLPLTLSECSGRGGGSGLEEVGDGCCASGGVVHQQQMSGVGDNLEPRLRNARGEDTTVDRRDDPIGATGQHERRGM